MQFWPRRWTEKLERETGFEPATSSLGSWHSTTELLPPEIVFNYLAESEDLTARPASLSSLSCPSSTTCLDRNTDSTECLAVLILLVLPQPITVSLYQRVSCDSEVVSSLGAVPMELAAQESAKVV